MPILNYSVTHRIRLYFTANGWLEDYEGCPLFLQNAVHFDP